MAKPSEELSRLRGERVKSLLKRYGWTQKQLANKLNISETALNAKLNAGRTLTEDDATEIAKLFPPVEVGWIMGIKNYPTKGEETASVIQQAKDEAELLNIGFGAFATLIGYSITPPQIQTPGPIEDVLSVIRQGYTISKDNSTIKLSISDMNRLQNKICEHVEIELKYLFKIKEC